MSVTSRCKPFEERTPQKWWVWIPYKPSSLPIARRAFFQIAAHHLHQIYLQGSLSSRAAPRRSRPAAGSRALALALASTRVPPERLECCPPCRHQRRRPPKRCCPPARPPGGTNVRAPSFAMACMPDACGPEAVLGSAIQRRFLIRLRRPLIGTENMHVGGVESPHFGGACSESHHATCDALET